MVDKNTLEKKLGLLQEYVTVLRQRLKVMDDFAQNIDAVHGGGELKPRLTFPVGFGTSQGWMDTDKHEGLDRGVERGLDKGLDRGYEWSRAGLGLGSGQESAVATAMINVPTTLEYADTLSIQHLHTLFDRRMALKKGSDRTSLGPAAGSSPQHSTSPTQQSTISSTGLSTSIVT